MSTEQARRSKIAVAARLGAALAFGLSIGGCSQMELLQLYVANNGTEVELEQALPLTLPFRDVDGWIIVPGSINGSPPVDFVLDTGASMLAVLTGPKTQSLPFDMSGVHRLGSADNLAAPVGAPQSGLNIDFGPLTLVDQSLLAIPVETLKCRDTEMPDPPFQGVVGHELFHRYVVEVNYDRGEVVLHDPDTYEYRGDGRIVPAEIKGRQPYVEAQVAAPDGANYTARMHVDSGAGIDISLFPQTHPEIVIPEGGETGAGCFVGGLATYHTGTTVDMRLGDAPEVTTPVSYSTGKEVIDKNQNGRVGAKFLRRFNVVFDYARERMILEPRVEAVVAR